MGSARRSRGRQGRLSAGERRRLELHLARKLSGEMTGAGKSKVDSRKSKKQIRTGREHSSRESFNFRLSTAASTLNHHDALRQSSSSVCPPSFGQFGLCRI